MKGETDADDNLPEFFKVYFRHHSFHQLLVPSEFADYIGRRKSGLAKLVAGSNGETWRVELVHKGNDLIFTEGWQGFVEDNLVGDGDFLFFKSNGNLVFSVTIYDKSTSEKGMEFIEESNQGGDSFLEIGEQQNKVNDVTRSCARPIKPDEVDETAGLTDVSVKPSFEKVVTLCSFGVPKSFVLQHSLGYKSCERMVLRNSRNSSWEVKIINNGGRIKLSGGWRAFLRENDIREGDVCKFELLDRLEMMVYVVTGEEGHRQNKVDVAGPKVTPSKRSAEVSQPGLKRVKVSSYIDGMTTINERLTIVEDKISHIETLLLRLFSDVAALKKSCRI